MSRRDELKKVERLGALPVERKSTHKKRRGKPRRFGVAKEDIHAVNGNGTSGKG